MLAQGDLAGKAGATLLLQRIAGLAAVLRLGIEPLYADWTNDSKEIEKWIEKFGSEGIPLTVVIPPGELEKVIALAGPFTEKMLLDAIEKTTQVDAAKETAQR